MPEERAAARAALRGRRTLPLAVLIGVVAAAAGAGLAWMTGQPSVAPALMISAAMVAVLLYALTSLRAAPIVRWALGRTFGSLRTLLPMMSRALPLLLLFVTFLFINAEVWQVAADLPTGTLWLTALLFVLLATGFLLVRLPEEVDKVDDEVDADFLRRTTAGTPGGRRRPRAARRRRGPPRARGVRRGARLRALEPGAGAGGDPGRPGAAAQRRRSSFSSWPSAVW